MTTRTSGKALWHTSRRGLKISNVNSPHFDWTFQIMKKSRLWQKKRAHKIFRSKLKDCTLVEFISICRDWLRSNPNDRVTESTTSSRSNDSNQQCSRPNSPARTRNSQRSPSHSVSRNSSSSGKSCLYISSQIASVVC